MDVVFSNKAKKQIRSFPKNTQIRILQAIFKLTENPPKGDIKPLQGYSDGRKRLRVGNYRISFRFEDNGDIYIYIIEVGVRGDFYK